MSAMKRVIQLDSDIERLRASVEKIDMALLDHEKRLIRIETLVELSRATLGYVRASSFR